MTTDIASSLTSSLGISSGINTTQLVSDLTSATYQPKLDLLNSRMSTANSQISAVASAKSSLDTFSNALSTLLKSSAYSGQPGSTDPTIVSVTGLAGGTPTGLPATVEVTQLARAQVLQSTTLSGPTAVAGTGDLTLTVGSSTYTITLGATTNKLSDLAAAINKSGAAVTATVMNDKDGARLVLKGTTGADQAFTLTPEATADTDLQRFAWDGTTGSMSRTQTALNAKINLDNVPLEFTSNIVDTAIPYLRLDLNKAAPGTSVTLATDQPTSTMADLMKQIVDAYNSLKGALNTATRTSDGKGGSSGLLANDSGVRDMVNHLARFASTPLAATGTYKTLNDLGVSTNRDGTLTLDTDRLNAALLADPAGVTQMLNPTTPSTTNPGVAGALQGIVDYVEGDSGPLTASNNTYTKLATNLGKQLDKVNSDKTDYSARLTTTYTAMQSRLLAYQSTKSYLDQQIAAWNNKSG